MTNPQVTLIQIDNYGPWTATPEPRREADLQALQARLYADLCRAFGDRDGYVFFTRFDNLIAVTNGTDREAHARIQESVGNRYPVTVSLSAAYAATPVAALAGATDALQAAGSAQDAERREILRIDALPEAERAPDDVRIAHFDVNDATEKYTDRIGAFDSFLRIQEGYLALARHLYRAHDSLAFFVGGDNAIAVGADLPADAYAAALDHVREVAGIELKVGVGSGATAQAAGMAAKHALETCRREDTRVEVDAPAARGD